MTQATCRHFDLSAGNLACRRGADSGRAESPSVVRTAHPQVSGTLTLATSAPRCSKTPERRAVIVGHSERRQHHGETDAIVASKALAARRAGLLAIRLRRRNATATHANGAALSICAEQIVAKRSHCHEPRRR